MNDLDPRKHDTDRMLIHKIQDLVCVRAVSALQFRLAFMREQCSNSRHKTAIVIIPECI